MAEWGPWAQHQCVVLALSWRPQRVVGTNSVPRAWRHLWLHLGVSLFGPPKLRVSYWFSFQTTHLGARHHSATVEARSKVSAVARPGDDDEEPEIGTAPRRD